MIGLTFHTPFDLACSLRLRQFQVVYKTCYCNYILFTELLWSENSEEIFQSTESSRHLPTTHGGGFIPFNAKCQAGYLRISTFVVFSLTRPEIEP